MKQLGAADGALNGALGRLLAVSEAYPELKANQNMMQLSEEITSTENRVSFARQAFNDAVMSFNNTVQVFPNNLIAAPFGFTAAQMLEIDKPEMRAAPKVSFT
jgi:LemA protein